MKAQPDAIAHSAAKIISRLKAGGEKTIQALKSLCWRCKGIQVEVTYKKICNLSSWDIYMWPNDLCKYVMCNWSIF